MSDEKSRERHRDWQRQNPEKRRQYRTESLRRKYLAEFIAEGGAQKPLEKNTAVRKVVTGINSDGKVILAERTVLIPMEGD